MVQSGHFPKTAKWFGPIVLWGGHHRQLRYATSISPALPTTMNSEGRPYLPLVESSPQFLELTEPHLPRVIPVQHIDHDGASLSTERFVRTTDPRGSEALLQFIRADLSILRGLGNGKD